MKARRQSAIVDAVRRQPIRSQEQLRHAIRSAGFDVTQATLSRDIRELQLVKGGADGAYQAPSRPAANGHGGVGMLQKALSEYLTKADQVKAAELEKNIAETAAALAKHPAAFPEVLVTSSRSGAGMPELRAAMVRLLNERS